MIFCLIMFLSFSILHPGGLAWAFQKTRTGTVIPGPSGVPVLGLLLVFTGSLTHRVLAKIAESLKAKSLMAFSVGFTRFIISSQPETAKEILNSSAFGDRPVKESAYELLFHRAMGFAPYGVYWRNLRRISATHLFSPRRISQLGKVRETIGAEMVNQIKQRGHVVKVRKMLHSGSLNNVMMSVFGKSVDEEIESLVFEGYELLGMFNWTDHFPLIGWLDLQGVRKRCRALATKVNRFVGDILLHHNNDNDFVHVLLQLQPEYNLTDSDIIAVLWVLTTFIYFYFLNYFINEKKIC